MRGTASYQRWQGTVAQATTMMSTVEPVIDERDVPRLLTAVEFAEVSDPAVSVVIPFYGQLAYTARCLASVAKHLPKMPIEVVLVDDQSPDASADVLSAIPGVRMVRNPSNAGFIESCNRGAAAARGEFLVFLNNDTEVQAHWCDELIRTLTDVPECGIAGAKLVYPDGRLQEAGGIVWRDGSAWNYGRMDDPRKPIYCYRRDVDYVSGAALAVPRELFFDVGGFDPCYTPAYYEDVDLAFKVRDRGRRVVFQPRSVVVHYEGISSGRDLSSGVKAYQVENARTFHARWRPHLASHHEPGQQVERARERGSAFRVLFLDHCTPEPDKDAGSGAVLHLFRILQGLGGKVTFIPEDNYLYLEPYTADLQRMGVECLYAPFVTSVKEHLQDAADSYDLILMYRYTTAVRHLPAIRRYAKRAKVVLLDVDLHFLREQREAELRNEPAVRERAERVKRQELAVIKQVDYTMVHSTVERDVLAAECSTCPVAVFGWVADAVGTTEPYESRRDLLFVGGFQHPPNVDAVVHFVNDVLPIIRQTLPDVRLYVVGSNPPAAVRELESDAVVIKGFVPDLRPLFDTVRAAIAPLRFGAGVKGKVATAMAHGVPSVATRIAAEGMELVPGRDIIVADSPEDFARGVCEVYTNPALWHTVSSAGLAAVQREFSSSRASAVISSVLDELGVSVPQDNVDVVRVSARTEYDAYVARTADELARRRDVEARLVPVGRSSFTISGLCVNCGTYTDLRVVVDERLNADGRRVPNWREAQICTVCGLNSRTRVALHAVQSWLGLGPDDPIYLMEQTTPLFRALSARYPLLVASEYLGSRVARGKSQGGIRNEDATALTFGDGRFAAILSFEVFEHIPDYRQAFRESARCLRPGGRLIFTAPFVTGNDRTLVRARLDSNGAVVHLEPPEYHGDPLSPKGGILCFQHFGWDILEALREAGFQSTEALLVWSRQFGYLGDNQLLFVATTAR
jgi:GT2 family glycosyltransferase/SAM-dependent methyltransferase